MSNKAVSAHKIAVYTDWRWTKRSAKRGHIGTEIAAIVAFTDQFGRSDSVSSRSQDRTDVNARQDAGQAARSNDNIEDP